MKLFLRAQEIVDYPYDRVVRKLFTNWIRRRKFHITIVAGRAPPTTVMRRRMPNGTSRERCLGAPEPSSHRHQT